MLPYWAISTWHRMRGSRHGRRPRVGCTCRSPRRTACGPRAEGGGHIDYLLAPRDLPFGDRGQELGPADHDLVWYDLPTATPPPTTMYAPRRALRDDTPLLPTDWQPAWDVARGAFLREIARGDTDAAWGLLSALAEDLLADGDGSGRPRAAAPALRRRPQVSRRGAVTSCRLSALLRLQRLVHHVQAFPHDDGARRGLERAVAHVGGLYPEVYGFDLTTLKGREEVDALVRGREQWEQQRRLAARQLDMLDDDAAALRWLKRAADDGEADSLGRDPHPQATADRERAK